LQSAPGADNPRYAAEHCFRIWAPTDISNTENLLLYWNSKNRDAEIHIYAIFV